MGRLVVGGLVYRRRSLVGDVPMADRRGGSMSSEPDHKIVEAMGKTWDQQGHYPPRNWHYKCLCGHYEHGLKDQMAMFAAWEEHARPEEDDGAP